MDVLRFDRMLSKSIAARRKAEQHRIDELKRSLSRFVLPEDTGTCMSARLHPPSGRAVARVAAGQHLAGAMGGADTKLLVGRRKSAAEEALISAEERFAKARAAMATRRRLQHGKPEIEVRPQVESVLNHSVSPKIIVPQPAASPQHVEAQRAHALAARYAFCMIQHKRLAARSAGRSLSRMLIERILRLVDDQLLSLAGLQPQLLGSSTGGPRVLSVAIGSNIEPRLFSGAIDGSLAVWDLHSQAVTTPFRVAKSRRPCDLTRSVRTKRGW